MLGEEGAGEVHQVGDDPVAGVCPEGGELKAVAGFGAPLPPGLGLVDGVEPGGVGVVLGVGAVGDDENLHILVQAAPGPEGVPLVAVDLVERLPDGHAPALEFNMYQGKTVDQHRHIVAVVVACPLLLADLILVDDLEIVVVDILFIDEGDVLGGAVIPAEHLDAVLLDLAGLLHDVLVGIGDGGLEELLPLAVGEGVVVEQFQLSAEVGDQVGLLVDSQILIALLRQHTDELPLQRRLALVAVGAGLARFILGHNGVLCGGCDNIILLQSNHLSGKNFLYRSSTISYISQKCLLCDKGI